MSIRSSEEYEDQGLKFLHSEQPARALEVFEEGTRRFPGDADLTMGTAVAHLRLGDYNQACQILEDLRRVSPQSSDTLQALAEAYLSRGMTADAVRVAQEAVDYSPQDARQLCRLGRVFYSRGWYREALPFYEHATQVGQNWSETWFGLGACLWSLRRAEEAQSALRQAVELEPTDWQARQFLGCVLCDNGHKEQAREMLESVPLDVSWQKPALERLLALAWWPSDPKKCRQMEQLWQKTIGNSVPASAAGLLEEVSRKMDDSAA
jgi:Flp pilus assembly protein TadD